MSVVRVYNAGLLTPRGVWSANPAIDYLANCRNLFRQSLDTLFAGYDPFCPALDMNLFLALKEHEHITELMIKRYSKSWLVVCDALLLSPEWKKSPGTLEEIKFAEDNHIPVFETLEELNKHEGR